MQPEPLPHNIEAELADIRDDIERILTKLSEQRGLLSASGSPAPNPKTITLDWLDAVASRAERLKETGFFFGVPSLDAALGAIRPGEYVLVGGVGKSLIAMQGALNAACRGIPTAIFSFEMLREQVMDRIAAHLGRVSMDAFGRGGFTKEECCRLGAVGLRLESMPLGVSGSRDGDDNIASIATSLRRMKAKHDLKVAVVDCLQRVRPAGKYDARYLEVDEVSDKLKSLALELDLVMVVPCQLNKDGLIRDSPSIKNDADVILKIVKDEKGQSRHDVLVSIVKNRLGDSFFAIPLRLYGEFMTIGERDPE
jgi:replicative DNA helicase